MGTVPDHPSTLIGIFPGPRRFPARPARTAESPSRLCEICWCDNALFLVNDTLPVVILDESTYQVLKQHTNQEIIHGSLGEQFLVKHLREITPEVGSLVTIGDAVLKVTAIVNFQALEAEYNLPANTSQQPFGLEAIIIEEGLIEPGAPVSITNPQSHRDEQT